MGKVRITEKPGWPYVLVNDFKSPPYFAYIETDSEGNKKFVRVLKGGPEKVTYEPLNLTSPRKKNLAKFLRDTLKTPSKYAKFMSQEWIEQLLKFLDIFDEQPYEVLSKLVTEAWLKKRCFQKVIREIRRNLKDDGGSSAVNVAEPQPCSSGCQSGQQGKAYEKNQTTDDDDYDDSSSNDDEVEEIELKEPDIETITLDD